MRTKKSNPGLTIEQHEELGAQLKAIRDQLVHIAVLVGNAYPLKTNAYKYAVKADDFVERLRTIMDDRLYDEHGNQLLMAGKDPNRVYYPPEESPESPAGENEHRS
jgi:hypothetical protein